jgi:hypothetical protein
LLHGGQEVGVDCRRLRFVDLFYSVHNCIIGRVFVNEKRMSQQLLLIKLLTICGGSLAAAAASASFDNNNARLVIRLIRSRTDGREDYQRRYEVAKVACPPLAMPNLPHDAALQFALENHLCAPCG